jgi:hypothetical protein
MSSTISVPYAKALFGAAFIQYLAYGILYVVEGCKYTNIKKNSE